MTVKRNDSLCRKHIFGRGGVNPGSETWKRVTASTDRLPIWGQHRRLSGALAPLQHGALLSRRAVSRIAVTLKESLEAWQSPPHRPRDRIPLPRHARAPGARHQLGRQRPCPGPRRVLAAGQAVIRERMRSAGRERREHGECQGIALLIKIAPEPHAALGLGPCYPRIAGEGRKNALPISTSSGTPRMLQAMSGKLTWVQAEEILRCSPRTLRRWRLPRVKPERSIHLLTRPPSRRRAPGGRLRSEARTWPPTSQYPGGETA